VAPSADTSPSVQNAGRGPQIQRVLWLTLGLNLLVSATKIVVGTMTGTLSLLADGYHSLMDASGNVLGLITLGFAHKPPDEDHQYGHRKFEVLASMGISILLFATAAEILHEAISRLRTGVSPTPSLLAIFAAAGTLVVNIFVAKYETRKGKELRSPFLLADSEHTRSDVFATIGVLLALFLIWAGVPWADPLAAAVIAAVIVLAGWRILTTGVNIIADRRVIDPASIDQIAASFEGVRKCVRVRTRGFEDAAYLDFTIRLNPDLSLREAHDLCDRIEVAVRQQYPQLIDIVIHQEPDEP
jgi:cation diffusion facilitator family transporter